MSFFNKGLFDFFGWKTNRAIFDAQKYLTKIKKNEWNFVSLSHNELREKTIEFKSKLVKKTKNIANIISLLKKQVVENANTKKSISNTIDKIKKNIIDIEEKILLELLPEAFSVMKETAKRFMANNEIFVQCSYFDRILSASKTYVKLYKDQALWKNSWKSVGKSIVWDMVYYDSQLIGGIVLHNGKIAEMATGEGKTLAATLAIYLNSLTGRGVHVVTVNDYLARRDYSWMAPIMEFHGLTVDCIENHPHNTNTRRQAYEADIIYGSNNEFVFDYLRDNTVHSSNEIVQREFNYAIVDEIDSILIDEGRTPIIISTPSSQGDKKEFEILKLQVKKIIKQQQIYLSKTLNEARELILLGDTKKGGFKLLQVHRGAPKDTNLIKSLNNYNIRSLLTKTKIHYMQDNDREMPKIDRNLYFVVNEKNNSIELTDKGVDLFSTNPFEQDFFILHDITREIKKIEYKKNNKKEELLKNYSIKKERIHRINLLLKAYLLFEKDIDYIVLKDQVKIIDKQTGRIMEGHRYSSGLHQAIESKENVKIKEENQPLAMITLQNYFSLYHKLAGMTGTAETNSGKLWKLDVVSIPTHNPISRKDYQDIIFNTKKEKYNAIINEIIKISKCEKRPVLVGTASVEVSELLSRMLKFRKFPHNVLNAKLYKEEANIIFESGKAGTVTIATNMAGRGTDIKLSLESKVSGGLAIIGVERHDSRRVDKQLLGRSGRHGTPGSSKFFISLEDSLLRLFGSSQIYLLKDKFEQKEGNLIQNSMITNSIKLVQKKIEENNSYIMKCHHKYDGVMNQQRKVVYSIRTNAVFINKISGYIITLLYKTIQEKDFECFGFEYFFINSKLFHQIVTIYKLKQEYNVKKIFPAIYYVYDIKNLYKKKNVFFMQGIKDISFFLDIKKYSNTNGKTLVQEFERSTVLSIVDSKWKEHIIDMEELRDSVQNYIYDQKDPFLIYKGEAFNMFNRTLNSINKENVSFIFQPYLSKIDVKKNKENWKGFIFL